jgi:hypothetical protein
MVPDKDTTKTEQPKNATSTATSSTSRPGCLTSSEGDSFLTTEELLHAIGAMKPISSTSEERTKSVQKSEPSRRPYTNREVAWTPQIGSARRSPWSPGDSKAVSDVVGDSKSSRYSSSWDSKAIWREKKDSAAGWDEDWYSGAIDYASEAHAWSSQRPIGASAKPSTPSSKEEKSSDIATVESLGQRRARRRGKVSEYSWYDETDDVEDETPPSASAAPQRKTRRRGKFAGPNED